MSYALKSPVTHVTDTLADPESSMKHFPRWFITSLLASSINILTPTIAFAEEANEAAPTNPDEAPAEVAIEDDGSKLFTSDGTRFEIEDLGISMTAPAEWEVMTKTASLSVIITEPKDPKPSYDKPKYQRNITLATKHNSTPIDEKRSIELIEEMNAKFGKDPMVSDFEILEKRFFNHRSTNDGLLIYSSLTLGEYQMMQMHILVSGEDNQFLISYTDLAERFVDQEAPVFQEAWASMTSLEVTGDTPLRRDMYIRYGAIAGTLTLLLLTLIFIQRKAARHDYGVDAEEIDKQDHANEASPGILATLHGEWNIADGFDENFSNDIDALENPDYVSHAPKTKRTERLSNY